MQVRSPLQMYHPSSASSDPHAISSHGRQHYPVSPPDPLSDDNMHPYHNAHAAGHGPSQRQQQQQQQQQRPAYPGQPPQLPSMHANMGVPHMAPAHALASHGHGAAPAQYGYAPNPYTLPPPHGVGVGGPVPQPERAVIPMSFSGDNGKYKFHLQVEQQPQRARMCGFGDKDRRPITPPPCIRLVITDLLTDKPVHVDDIDGSFFVLQVDLWDESAQREVNIVRASSSSPAVSISTATTTSFPPTPDRPLMGDYGQPAMMYQTPDGQTVMGYARGPMGGAQYPYGVGYPPQGYGPPGGAPGAYPGNSAHINQQFTRNLIGSLTVNASKLQDLNNKEGFWFVLQDLSVRTEGEFRLKINFIDVGAPPSQTNNGTSSTASTSNGNSAGGNNTLNRGRANVLASAFTNSFHVYSAKKFPGVIESTPLSKKFAAQGIKIPIRKDGKNERGDGEDDE